MLLEYCRFAVIAYNNRSWLILNPSHSPYSGKLLTNAMLNIHKRFSVGSSIKNIIIGTNIFPGRKYKAAINYPSEWTAGKQSKLEIRAMPASVAWYTFFKID